MTLQHTHKLAYLSLLLMFLTACSSDDDFAQIKEGIDDLEGAIVKLDGFQPGDAVSRSALVYGKDGMVFAWDLQSQLGLYPTAQKPTKTKGKDGQDVFDFNGLVNPNDTMPEWANKWHPSNTEKSKDGFFYTDPSKTEQAQYKCTEIRSGGLYAKIMADGSSSFDWNVEHDDSIRWSAYSPYNASYVPLSLNPESGHNYNSLPFDFTGQIQRGYVDMGALYTATESNKFDNPTYKASEEAACAHLGEKDFLFSAETKFNYPQTRFEMRHVGAVARFFLLAPAKDLTLVSLRLICDKKIFYEKGLFDLTSREYVADATKGLCLVGDDDENKQMRPDENTLTNNLLLEFNNVRTLYYNDTRYGNYLIAYLMMYPITYNTETDRNLFAFVTAKDADGKIVNFVSEPLASKTMVSGKYYQWTSRTHEDDGLYPIELTATLLPWQDIVGAGIETDLTK